MRGGRRAPHRRTLALVAVGVVVAALHAGLGAAMVATRPWTGWALDIVLAAVVVKLLVSSVVGRRIVQHRNARRLGVRRDAGRCVRLGAHGDAEADSDLPRGAETAEEIQR
jgi:hypothetical protein